jgi:hypothetical protein
MKKAFVFPVLFLFVLAGIGLASASPKEPVIYELPYAKTAPQGLLTNFRFPTTVEATFSLSNAAARGNRAIA